MNKLYIVSIGAGGTNYITSEAKDAINESKVVVSYSKYARELEELLCGKKLITSGMTHEIQRCNQAVESAKNGRTTSILSNGDSNVFGISSIIVELLEKRDLWNDIELINIPGVTSFLAAASKVGAPISQDFFIISLSNRSTDIKLVDKRVKLALECDVVLGIYNPKSKKRVQPYQNFLKRLKEVDERIVIIARSVGRENKEEITITNSSKLFEDDLIDEKVCMNTLLIVCNSTTKLTQNGLVLTPK